MWDVKPLTKQNLRRIFSVNEKNLVVLFVILNIPDVIAACMSQYTHYLASSLSNGHGDMLFFT